MRDPNKPVDGVDKSQQKAAASDIHGDLDTTLPHNPKSIGDVKEVIPGGRYTIISEIDRGGMGVVYRAIDSDVKRPLAVKVLLERGDAGGVPEERFLNEARITGQLQHPGIAPVHEIGRLDDGRPFFSMKLIVGRTLAVLLRERPSTASDLPRFLKVFEQIAQALAYAHSEGIIHRDLKPANVMIGAFGEVQVMDWGLARRMSEEEPTLSPADQPSSGTADETKVFWSTPTPAERLTCHGQVLGTPAYMPPEQARGHIESLDERSDVFGMGAILCSILTGRPPYELEESENPQRLAVRGDLSAALLRLENCGADVELIRLSQECLAAEADNRPANAGVVAKRVSAYLNSAQERLKQAAIDQAAAEARAIEQQKRIQMERSKRRITMGLAVAVLVLVIGGGAAVWWYQQAKIAADIRAEQAGKDIVSTLSRAVELRKDYRFDAAEVLLAQAQRRLSAISEPGRISDQVVQAKGDLNVVRRLDEIRLRKANAGFDYDFANGREGAYAQAFRDYGIDIFGDDPSKQLANRIAASAVSVSLIAGLDDWAHNDDRENLPRVFEIIRSADPDSFRDRIRDPAVWRNGEALLDLAESDELARQPPNVVHNLGMMLKATGHRSTAAILLTRAAMEHPADFWIRFVLAELLGELNRPLDSIGHYQAAVAIRPDNAAAYNNLGNQLKKANRLEEAEAALRRAIKADPRYSLAHFNLGKLLHETGKVTEAEAEWREAIDADPNSTLAHYNLGKLLFETNRLEEAEDSYLHVIKVDPKHAWAHAALGSLYTGAKRVKDAESAYNKAIQADPKYAAAHYNLGLLLQANDRATEAKSSYRAAIKADPNYAEAHCNLGGLLMRETDRFAEAVKLLTRGHELGSAREDWQYPSTQWVALAKRRLALDEKITAFQNDAQSPANSAESLELAMFALRRKHQPRIATQLYRTALSDPSISPELRFQHEYLAACAALLCAAGKVEKGADSPDVEEAAKLRKQALEWLTANLPSLQRQIETAEPKSRAAAIRHLRHWYADGDLAIVHSTAIEQLPEAERKGWRKLWADVAKVLKSASRSRNETPVNEIETSAATARTRNSAPPTIAPP